MKPRDLSPAAARRLALDALGFGVKKPARAGVAHVRATAIARASAASSSESRRADHM